MRQRTERHFPSHKAIRSNEMFMSGKVMENTLIIGLLSSLLEQSFIIALDALILSYFMHDSTLLSILYSFTSRKCSFSFF
jgi:hypothetical protein